MIVTRTLSALTHLLKKSKFEEKNCFSLKKYYDLDILLVL